MSDLRIGFDPPDVSFVVVPLLVVAALCGAAVALRRRRVRQRAGRWLTVAVLFAVGVALTPWLRGGIRNSIHLSLIGCGVLALAIATIRNLPGVSPVRRFTLISIRVFALLVLLFALLRPVVGWTTQRPARPTLVLALDASRSMSIADVPRGNDGGFRSRAAAVRLALARSKESLDRLVRDWNVVYASFSDTARFETDASRTPPDADPDGPATSLATIVSATLARPLPSDSPLAGLLLLSDGADNMESELTPIAAARAADLAGLPIYGVCVGSDQPQGDTRSIIARRLTAPARAATGTRIDVVGEFDCLGYANESITFELLWDEQIVDTRTVQPTQASESVRAAFDVDARPQGFHAVEVRVAGSATDRDKAPISLTQFVHVTDDAIQVLLVESRPRSESAFIGRALAGEQRVRLTRMYLARPAEGEWTNPLPATRDAWRAWQVVILGGVTRAEATDKRLASLSEAVQRDGVGLILLGGLDASGSRSILSGALGEVLPIERGKQASVVDEERRVLPTPGGKAHPVCRLTDSAEGGAARVLDWERLCRVPGGTPLGRAKPAAEVLLADDDKRPVLAVQTVGKGRTAALAVDTTWRWAMRSDDGAALHRQFWRQLVFWLAGRQARVHVGSDKPRYDRAQVRPGGRGVRVEAFILETGGGEGDAAADVRLIGPDGNKSPVVMQRGGDRWVGRAFAEAVGTYQLALTARRGAETVGEAESRFVVEDLDRELREPLANPTLLRALSDATQSRGGRMVPLADLGPFLETLAKNDALRTRTERTEVDLSGRFAAGILALVCALLFLEWTIRKRSGLA